MFDLIKYWETLSLIISCVMCCAILNSEMSFSLPKQNSFFIPNIIKGHGDAQTIDLNYGVKKVNK